MPEFDGTYTRKAGLQRAYSYRVTYSIHNGLLHWSALVSIAGKPAGRPNGTRELGTATDEEQRRVAEDLTRASIENLADVNE